MKLGILPCQGACNVGQMTNRAALKFVDNEKVNMVCSLGLPLGLKKVLEMAAVNEKYIALNGCPLNCASKALESAGISNFDAITLTTEFGIEKNKNFSDDTKIDEVEAKVQSLIENYFTSEGK